MVKSIHYRSSKWKQRRRPKTTKSRRKELLMRFWLAAKA